MLLKKIQTVFDHVQGTFTKSGKENPNLRDYTGLVMDQLAFSLAPLIKAIGSIGMNLSNINPIDTYTGRPMIDPLVFEADDYREIVRMHLQIGNEIGENEIYENQKYLNKISARERLTINTAANKTLKGIELSKDEKNTIILNSRNVKKYINQIKKTYISINTNTIEGILISDTTSLETKMQALNTYINLTNKLENN